MRRFATDKLLDWKKKSNRKPLILMGARQVGKTWLMKEFGKTYYKKTAYISFYNNQRMQAVFDTDFDIKRIIMNLNIESGGFASTTFNNTSGTAFFVTTKYLVGSVIISPPLCSYVAHTCAPLRDILT